MNDNLLKHINEYFNTFNPKDYTIYVDGTPTEWCKLNDYSTYVIWKTPPNSDWHGINVCQIEAIRLTPTTMEIVKTNGKEYKLVAKLKSKEKKAKDIILKVKNALYVGHINEALDYLDELKTLMNV